jgi:hypothetical protein
VAARRQDPQELRHSSVPCYCPDLSGPQYLTDLSRLLLGHVVVKLASNFIRRHFTPFLDNVARQGEQFPRLAISSRANIARPTAVTRPSWL